MYAMSKQEEPLPKKVKFHFTVRSPNPNSLNFQLLEKYQKWYVGADKLAKARQGFVSGAKKTKKKFCRLLD